MDITTDSLGEIYCIRLKFKEINAVSINYVYLFSKWMQNWCLHIHPLAQYPLLIRRHFKCNFYLHFFFFWQLQFRKVYISIVINTDSCTNKWENWRKFIPTTFEIRHSTLIRIFQYTDIHANLFIQTRFLSNKASVYLKKKTSLPVSC